MIAGSQTAIPARAGQASERLPLATGEEDTYTNGVSPQYALEERASTQTREEEQAANGDRRHIVARPRDQGTHADPVELSSGRQLDAAE